MRVRIAVVLSPRGDIETLQNTWDSDMRFWHAQYAPETTIGEGEYRCFYEVRKHGFLYPLLTSITGYIGIAIERGELASADIVVDAFGMKDED